MNVTYMHPLCHSVCTPWYQPGRRRSAARERIMAPTETGSKRCVFSGKIWNVLVYFSWKYLVPLLDVKCFSSKANHTWKTLQACMTCVLLKLEPKPPKSSIYKCQLSALGAAALPHRILHRWPTEPSKDVSVEKAVTWRIDEWAKEKALRISRPKQRPQRWESPGSSMRCLGKCAEPTAMSANPKFEHVKKRISNVFSELFESWRAKWHIPRPAHLIRFAKGSICLTGVDQEPRAKEFAPTKPGHFSKDHRHKDRHLKLHFGCDLNIFCSNTRHTGHRQTLQSLQGWLLCWKCWGSLLSHLNVVPVQRLGPAPAESAADTYSFHCTFRSSMEKKL